jgi:hypothetical protein
MLRLLLLALALLGFLAAPAVRADSFAIELAVKAKDAETTEAKYPAADSKPQPRATLTAGVNAPITVKWTLRNTHQTQTVSDVLVHFFAVKIDKPNQAEIPKLTKNVVVETALTMDFRPQDKTDGEITFTVASPGVYLLRLELRGNAAKEGRDHYAALDLIVR